MAVIVELFFMCRMDVHVRTMVARVIMIMKRRVPMVMPMFVLVPMLVPMGVRLLVCVRSTSVGMFVRMAVSVLVGMQMLVLVVALHCELLSFGVAS